LIHIIAPDEALRIVIATVLGITLASGLCHALIQASALKEVRTEDAGNACRIASPQVFLSMSSTSQPTIAAMRTARSVVTAIFSDR
jgi:hypothetical protein